MCVSVRQVMVYIQQCVRKEEGKGDRMVPILVPLAYLATLVPSAWIGAKRYSTIPCTLPLMLYKTDILGTMTNSMDLIQ